MMIYFRLLIVLFFLGSCCINEPYENSNKGEIIQSVSIDTIDFYLINYLDENEEIIIRDQTSYQSFISQKQKKYGCKLKEFVTIDWDKYSLIGRKTVNEGCNGYFERNVYWENSKMIYEITKNTCGSCNSTTGSDNLVLVSKIPHFSEVIFIVK